MVLLYKIPHFLHQKKSHVFIQYNYVGPFLAPKKIPHFLHRLFLYVTIATVISHKKQADECGGVGLLGISWGMIFVLVYCTAGISGGHINPAVTFGMLVARKVTLARAVAYTVAECLGGISGVGLLKAFMKDYYMMHGGGVNSVTPGYSNAAALGAEIFGTFLLVYTVFSASDPKRSARDSHVPGLAPLPIGFAVFMVHLATIPITGTGINRARSFAAAVIYNNDKVWEDQVWEDRSTAIPPPEESLDDDAVVKCGISII